MGNAEWKLEWLGHACFKVSRGDYSVVLDPYEDGSVPGLGNIREEADCVLCSHGHGDHNFEDGVTLRKTSENPFKVTKVEGFHDDANGSLRGPNTIFILEADGMRLAHFGDIGCELSAEQKEAIGKLDFALIPVGGFYTIDGSTAAKIIKEFAPTVAVPMHFHGENFGYDVLSGSDVFMKEFDCSTMSGKSELTLSKDMPKQIVELVPARLL